MIKIYLSIVLMSVGSLSGQIIGVNLIKNGDAEAGTGTVTSSNAPVTTVPEWVRQGGTADVARYDSGDFIRAASSPAPASRGSNFFSGGPSNALSELSQQIDISAGQALIASGGIVYNASAYLGGLSGDKAVLSIAFIDGAGVVLRTIQLETGATSGLFRATNAGLVPTATRRVTVNLQFTRANGSYNDGMADNLSLVFSLPSPTRSLLGTNLLANAGAEEGTPLTSRGSLVNDIPGWSRKGEFDINSYPYTQAVQATIAVPNRGVAVFTGGSDAVSEGYQYIDLSSAAALIDAGTLRYAASAWLGGYLDHRDSASYTVQFQDGNGRLLETADIGTVTAADRQNLTVWQQRTKEGTVPTGARIAVLRLVMTRLDGTANDGYADNLTFQLNASDVSRLPSIRGSGVLSATAFGGFGSIAPGLWVEIYGSNLADRTRSWDGADFTGPNAPRALSGVRVFIDNKPAFISYISPTQVNALIPSDVSTGPMRLTVANSLGASDPYPIMVEPVQPGFLAPPVFLINGRQYLGALYADGVTFALPTGSVSSIATRTPAPGDTLIVYGVGFGKVKPDAPAGALVSGLTELEQTFEFRFGDVPAALTFKGLAPGFTGLYQFNVVVPRIPDNDAVPVSFFVGGLRGAQSLFLPVKAQ